MTKKYMLPKYRVFDERLKIIRSIQYIDFENEKVMFYADDFKDEDYEPDLSITRSFDEVDIMQAVIGVIDRRGKTIYEGDILRVSSDKYKTYYLNEMCDPEKEYLTPEEEKDLSFELVGPVEMIDYELCLKTKAYVQDIYSLVKDRENDVEVIGNIYEDEKLDVRSYVLGKG